MTARLAPMTAMHPPLDTPLAGGISYRDFFAGETYARLTAGASTIPPEFLPVQPATWQAMARLAEELLAPLADRFGAPRITYGFAATALTKHIARDICPVRDQHAGAELNSRGNLICPRGGIAVDLIFPGTDSLTAAIWARDNLPFDRLYYYGPDRPFHISVGPDESRATTTLYRSRRTGRRFPRKIPLEAS